MSSLFINMAKGDGLTNGAPLGHEVVYFLYIAAELKDI
jgi:hypothetical protein